MVIFAAIATGWIFGAIATSLILGPMLAGTRQVRVRTRTSPCITTTLHAACIVVSEPEGTKIPASVIAEGGTHYLSMSLN